MPPTITLGAGQSQSAELAKKLRHLILDRKLPVQEPLPPQRELSNRFQVGVQVVRSAMQILEEEGLIFKRERQGAFIRPDRATDATRTSQTRLRCINFMERLSGTVPGYVRTDYLQGFSEAMESLDVKMRFLPCPSVQEQFESLFSPNFLPQEQGCVLINVLSAPLMQWLSDRKIPFVVQSNRTYPTFDYPPHYSVCINKVLGGFETARHLIELGHRRIGFIGSAPRDGTWSNDVYSGCLASMALGGLHFHMNDVLDFATNELAMAIEPVRRYLDRPQRPSAVIAHNDVVALAILDVAKEMGLRVPEDLSVVGFDDVPEAEASDPPLTSFANPRVLLGRTVVQTLLAVAAGDGDVPMTQVIKGQLVVRHSTAAPAQSS